MWLISGYSGVGPPWRLEWRLPPPPPPGFGPGALELPRGDFGTRLRPPAGQSSCACARGPLPLRAGGSALCGGAGDRIHPPRHANRVLIGLPQGVSPASRRDVSAPPDLPSSRISPHLVSHGICGRIHGLPGFYWGFVARRRRTAHMPHEQRSISSGGMQENWFWNG